MENYIKPNKNIPVIPMRNTLIYPGQTIPIVVGRQRSRTALEAALKQGESSWLITVAQREDSAEQEPVQESLYKIGTLCRIKKVEGAPGKAYHVTLDGVARFQISEFKSGKNFLSASGQILDDILDGDSETIHQLKQNLRQLAKEIFQLLPMNTDRLEAMTDSIEDAGQLSFLIAQYLDIKLSQRQEILETLHLKERLLALLDLLVKQREEIKVQKTIQEKVASKLGKQQREAIVREQIRALREELGDDNQSQNDDLRTKIDEAGMPDDVNKIALEQLQRLESLSQQSPENQIIRNYLDLLVALPWSKSADADVDIEKAKAVLTEDHYGLDKIKKRILQYLAVLKLKKSRQGTILLFVGPPGVGKTSLGRSIARAMGRKFVRASLGGVRDDAEIRGHRRTYIGALPGRIIESLKRAGENNPVFVLDEIDKVSRGWGGDPASALLEALDPEQNTKFLDHYLDVPFDLSKVIFIATANTTETIPPALLDRMEVIQLSGYTTLEKLHIAKTHLLPKLFEEHGLTLDHGQIDDKVLLAIIQSYTRESGVRELQRMLAGVVRHIAEKVISRAEVTSAVAISTEGVSTKGVSAKDVSAEAIPKIIEPVVVLESELDEFLGPAKYVHELIEETNPPGVAIGMAWTPVGGEILFFESNHMPGSGKLTITGQLGDVMKESAQIALSLVRSRLLPLTRPFNFEKEDLHLHVPAGAVPKDGPSAGVALAVTMASLVMNRPVSGRLAMTGEITLRGAVTPVGGIKEKVIAAHRAGVKEVILPLRNERDLREVPEDVRRDLRIHLVQNIDDVLRIVFGIETLAAAAPGLSFESSQSAADSGAVGPAH